ncbi:conserved hypothetical protein [Talaromyces stipitatus ATCC 10500]|uniref:Retrotransposon gag domain-containing protein n=1 Tax=Talaromyces stipitatus (strain ATCC 10500 / CBS 375.48 / QM 6759 / NRRL 1006) TaxID=441959 RepID=B8LV76_TALSN|nr:uncharacterized protein TSTA_065790 [Talaromyces stipitatus ATCC 10500]EED23126.1 conserved hypothetical protein [Talaromyces stipitatus ATCC 10500]
MKLYETLNDNEKEYDTLLVNYNKLAEEDNALKDDYAVLQIEFSDLQKELEELKKARDDLIADHDLVEILGAALVNRPSKSTKLPKGAKLSDGVDPIFDSWLIDMRHSLNSNEDHYDTPETRMAFVKRICEGKAARYLLPQMREDSLNPFVNVEDMFEHLKTIFHDVNRVVKAKNQLFTLQMKKDTHFQDFLAEFTELAQDSEINVAK